MKKIDETVLAYIENDQNQYLLLYRNKEEGDLNEGYYMGVGGHLEEGETKEDALIREVWEETKLKVVSYKYQAKIYFSSDEYDEVMHLYLITKVEGEIDYNCDEGDLSYVDKDKLSTLPMWEGDKIFLKKMLNNDDYFELKLVYKGRTLVEVKEL